MSRAVLVMAKQPSPGRTKTRLVPPLTAEEASDLYQAMLCDIVDSLARREDCTLLIAVDEPESMEWFRTTFPAVPLIVQVGETLGERLDGVLTHGLTLAERAFAISSDSPDLPPKHLTELFALLDHDGTDAVLGPTEDGGYWAIGWNRPLAPIVREVTMSTATVLADTLAVADRIGATVALGPSWYDVDEEPDLHRLAASSTDNFHPKTAHQLTRCLAPTGAIGARHLRTELPSEANETNDSSRRCLAPKGAIGARHLGVVVPALDEAGNIGVVVGELFAHGADRVFVVDNGSTDGTADEASAAGATVISEPVRGYGRACAAGTAAAIEAGCGIVAYIDGDRSSRASELMAIVQPILDDSADLVLGSRVLGTIEDGAMPPHQRFGNRVTSALMRRLYRVEVTDLGPYRAIRADLVDELDLTEMTFGWPTEMMVKAAARGDRIIEVPASWDRRVVGESKVGGTIIGSLKAGWFLLTVTLRHARAARRR